MLHSSGSLLAALTLFCILVAAPLAQAKGRRCWNTGYFSKGNSAELQMINRVDEFNNPTVLDLAPCAAPLMCFECTKTVGGMWYYGATCIGKLSSYAEVTCSQKGLEPCTGDDEKTCSPQLQKFWDLANLKKCRYARAENGKITEGGWEVYCDDVCSTAIYRSDGTIFMHKGCKASSESWLSAMRQEYPVIGNSSTLCVGDGPCGEDETPMVEYASDMNDATDESGSGSFEAGRLEILALAALLGVLGQAI